MTGVRVEVVHTGLVDAAVLAQARELLDAVFAGELTDDDWEHCLGGLHALAWHDGELVGHAALVQRRLLLGGRALRTGYVEGVAVQADVRRRGIGGAVMAPLEQVAGRAYALTALATSAEGARFYAARLGPWQGPTWALTADGAVRTLDDDDCVLVLPVPGLDRTAALTCDVREGDPW